MMASRPLDLPPSPLIQDFPAQLFRAFNSSECISIEALWNQRVGRFVILSENIAECFGQQVEKVTREDGSIVSFDVDDDMWRLKPHCYRLHKGALVVHFKKSAPNPVASLPGIVNNVDLLFDQMRDSRREDNWDLFQQSLREIETRFAELIIEEHESAQVLAVKCLHLHLYPVPRQFFVLRKKDSPLSRNLQLFLLCECESSKDNQTNPPSEDVVFEETEEDTKIHMSNHGGYDITRPKEFCEKHGPRILMVLRCLQVGLMVAGIVIPGLAAANKTGLFTTILSAFSYNNPSFTDPFEKTKQFVAHHCDLGLTSELDSCSAKVEIPQPLEGPAYNHFRQFLQEADKKGTNGNLTIAFCHRTGRLKWVCKDHCEPSARGKFLLRDLEFEASKMKTAQLDILSGSLTMELPFGDNKGKTSTFYKALIAAPGVNVATVILGSSTSESDFNLMALNIGIANVPRVVLNGSRLGGGSSTNVSDFWYKRVVTFMMSSRCRVIRLVGFQGFFDRAVDITNVQGDRFSHLISLQLDVHIDLRLHMDQLRNMLRLFPGLKYLTINAAYNSTHLKKIQQVIKNLRILTMILPDFMSVVAFSMNDDDEPTHFVEIHTTGSNILLLQGRPQNTILGHLVSLKIDFSDNPQCLLRQSLVDLAYACPQLRMFDIHDSLDQLGSLVEAFNTLPAKDRVIRLQSLKTDHHVSMTIEHKENLPPTTVTMIQMTDAEEGNLHLKKILRDHGPTVQSLVTNGLCGDDLFYALLSSISYGRSSRLEHLTIDQTGLVDVIPIKKLADMLPDLKLTLSLTHLQIEDQQIRGFTCVEAFGCIAERLLLHGQGNSLDWVKYLGYYGTCFRKLRSLEITFGGGRASVDTQALTAIEGLIQSVQATKIPFQSFTLSNFDLTKMRWGRLLNVLNFNTLQSLSVEDTNFSSEQMKALIMKLPEPSMYHHTVGKWTMAPLNELFIKGTDLVKDKGLLSQLETRLLQRVPGIRVIIS
ncbi:hypothetical protein EMPS_05626 [Entomortierella parvispora]|uniref:Uncharacterized protein n=1 Tax=Entomortierella parvispora TaxID=205924 RepID=A0A9P3LWP0_9FUNG|nr:hypothetical protein EMPS_05626 [Entomortierella parvispora]